MISFEYEKRLRCSRDEKMKCLDLIKEIMRLSEDSRRHGLLALEDYIENDELPFLLRRGMAMVVDGTDLNIIQKTLERYVSVKEYTGYELLKRLICIDAVLSLQAGENPRIIRDQLIAFLGEDFYEEALQYFSRIDFERPF